MRLMYPISNVKLQIENKIGRLNMGRKQKGSPKMQPPPKMHPVKRILEVLSRYLYNILYIALLAVLWRYIILNWEKCISMQFFSQFDGNNILFLVGIALVTLKEKVSSCIDEEQKLQWSNCKNLIYPMN